MFHTRIDGILSISMTHSHPWLALHLVPCSDRMLDGSSTASPRLDAVSLQATTHARRHFTTPSAVAPSRGVSLRDSHDHVLAGHNHSPRLSSRREGRRRLGPLHRLRLRANCHRLLLRR